MAGVNALPAAAAVSLLQRANTPEGGLPVGATGTRLTPVEEDERFSFAQRLDVEEKTRCKVMALFGLVAVCHVALDAYMYFVKGRCILGLDDDMRMVLVVFQLVCVVNDAFTYCAFQLEAIHTLTSCYQAIKRLNKHWKYANVVDQREKPLEKYRKALQDCRTWVKEEEEDSYYPLTTTLVIQLMFMFICVLQIWLRWYSYNSRTAIQPNKTLGNEDDEGWIDDPLGVVWYAILAVLRPVQLWPFVRSLCSINDEADKLGQVVMEEFRRPSEFSLLELVALSERCPVSFHIMGFRLSKAKISAALVTAGISILTLGMTSLKQVVVPLQCVPIGL